MLVQLLVVVAGMSLLSLMVMPAGMNVDTAWHTFSSGYLLAQSESIRYEMRNEYVSEDGQRVTFNEYGNVPYPRTLHFDHHDIIIELGGGRLVET